MKKKSFISCILAFMMLVAVCLSGCANKDGEADTNLSTYTIQYADAEGIHKFSVQSGDLYSLESIPSKNGYEFLGLYDAETGGTQYVNAGGSAVAAFTDNKNIVLYPQFRAKEFTLILDYQGAAVTGARSMKVSYDSEISELPLNLTLENKNFVGWYTEPNRKGNQIADQYGVLPENRKVTEKLFDLSDPDGNIKLYAGFKGEEFTVTFYFTESGAPEEVKVEYGTPISEVQLATRVDGKAVIAWSKKRNDTNKEEVFNGKVTSDMILYAAEYAPFIEFDSNGGKKINSMIVRAGEEVKLPVPEKENYKFVGWQDLSGNCYESYTMTDNNVKLTAKWHAMIMFDANGGTNVEAVSAEAGSNITLPVPERGGYIFAGWYRGATQYAEEIMPKDSVTLKAGWYQERSARYVVCASNSEIMANCRLAPYNFDQHSGRNNGFYYYSYTNPYNYGSAFQLIPPVSSFFGADSAQYKNFRIEFHAQMQKRSADGKSSLRMAIYPTSTIVSADLIKDCALATLAPNEWQTVEFTESLWVKGDPNIYFYCDGNGFSCYLKDVYYTLYYADTATLIL